MSPDDAESPATDREPFSGPELSADEAAPAAPEQPETGRPETKQSELDLGMVSTGSADVDHALHPLDAVGDRPVAEHPEIFDRVLGDLTETMTNTAPAAPPATD